MFHMKSIKFGDGFEMHLDYGIWHLFQNVCPPFRFNELATFDVRLSKNIIVVNPKHRGIIQEAGFIFYTLTKYIERRDPFVVFVDPEKKCAESFISETGIHTQFWGSISLNITQDDIDSSIRIYTRMQETQLQTMKNTLDLLNKHKDYGGTKEQREFNKKFFAERIAELEKPCKKKGKKK